MSILPNFLWKRDIRATFSEAVLPRGGFMRMFTQLCKHFVGILSVLILFLLPFPVFSAEPVQELPPDLLIKSITTEVIAIIKDNEDARSSPEGRKRLVDLVEAKVAPHFDFVAMTRLAVGVNWRSATPAQRERLVEEFRALLLHTYSRVLFLYQDNAIVFKPFRTEAGATDATVRMEIKSGGEVISVDFVMEKTSEGWKIYNVSVGGISLVINYRDSFTTKVRESGIDGLIRDLTEKNRQLEKQQ